MFTITKSKEKGPEYRAVFTCVKLIADYITIIGDQIRNKVAMYILWALGLDYKGFVTSMNLRSIDQPSFELQS